MTSTDPVRLTPHLTLGLLRELEATIGSVDGDLIEVVAPFTMDVIGRVRQSTPDDVERAARMARDAQPAWEALGATERARILLRFHDILLSHVDQLIDLVQLEGGKARMDAWK